MSVPIVTIYYGNEPIRITGLPDEPKFYEEDICRILPNWTGNFKKGLELFSLEDGTKLLNTAGVYRVIFKMLSLDDNKCVENFERWFVEEIEPALRKYGYPIGKSSF